MKIIPTGPEILHEAMVVAAGAFLAAYVLSNFPVIRDYIAANLRGVQGGQGGAACNCRNAA